VEESVDPHLAPLLVHGHGPRIAEGRTVVGRRDRRLVGALQACGQVVVAQHAVHLDIGVDQQAGQRRHLALQRRGADIDGLGQAHLYGQHDVVRPRMDLHVAQQPLVRRHARRGRIDRRV
jgi:hypothetical protein